MQYDFNEIRSLGDAHKQYMYQLIIAPLPGTGGDVTEKVLSMRNVSCTLPGEGVQDIPYSMGGYQFHEAGQSNVDGNNWSCTFVESMNVGVRKRLETWLALANNRRTNVQELKSVYQTTGEIRLHDGTGSTQYVGKLYGLWINNIGSNQFQNRTNQVTNTVATFSYDLWEPAN